MNREKKTVIQCPLFGDIVAEEKYLVEENRALKERLDDAHFIIQEKNKRIKADWEKRKQHLNQVFLQILDVIIRYPGLRIKDELGEKFRQVKGYKPLIDNRVRDLRKEGLVITVPGEDGLLRAYPTSKAKEVF